MLVCNSAFALRLSGKGVQNAFKLLTFDAPAETVITNDNVLKMRALTFGILNAIVIKSFYSIIFILPQHKKKHLTLC